MITIDTIKTLRPNLTNDDFKPSPTGTILLFDNNDGYGARIIEWNHPTETQPTQEEIDGVE